MLEFSSLDDREVIEHSSADLLETYNIEAHDAIFLGKKLADTVGIGLFACAYGVLWQAILDNYTVCSIRIYNSNTDVSLNWYIRLWKGLSNVLTYTSVEKSVSEININLPHLDLSKYVIEW